MIFLKDEQTITNNHDITSDDPRTAYNFVLDKMSETARECINGTCRFVVTDKNNLIIYEKFNIHTYYMINPTSDKKLSFDDLEKLLILYPNTMKKYSVVIDGRDYAEPMENKYKVIINVNIVENNN